MSTEHCVKSTGDNLLSILQSDNVFNLFAEKLHESEQTDKFVQCIKSIASGRFSTTNLAWKSFLDMGCLSNLQLTTQMVYDSEWLEFCQIIYHMFGAGVINALHGRGHFSQVTSNRTLKNKYDPTEGEFNFPMPSIPTLKKLDIGFPAEIPIGFVEQSLQLAEMKSKSGVQFILSFDGKLVAPGCKGDQKGDTDMWGIEGPPNLSTSIKILHETLTLANAINVDVENSTVKNHFHNLWHLLHASSLRIKHLWRKITGSFYLRKKLIEKCGDNQELQYKHRRQMSSLNQNTAECESVVRCLLEMNMLTTQIMSSINNNSDVHIQNKPRHISLIEHANNFQLLPPEIVKYVLDIENDTNIQFIKQRSPEWFQIRKQARITSSTLNSGIGLDTLQKQKQHFYVHV